MDQLRLCYALNMFFGKNVRRRVGTGEPRVAKEPKWRRMSLDEWMSLEHARNHEVGPLTFSQLQDLSNMGQITSDSLLRMQETNYIPYDSIRCALKEMSHGSQNTEERRQGQLERREETQSKYNCENLAQPRRKRVYTSRTRNAAPEDESEQNENKEILGSSNGTGRSPTSTTSNSHGLSPSSTGTPLRRLFSSEMALFQGSRHDASQSSQPPSQPSAPWSSNRTQFSPMSLRSYRENDDNV